MNNSKLIAYFLAFMIAGALLAININQVNGFIIGLLTYWFPYILIIKSENF
jgi:hypothetical protein